jgi:hypothetical protein
MQDLIVYLIVAGAAAYVLRTIWNALAGGKSGCNSCGSNCASQSVKAARRSTPAAQQLVQIDLGNLNRKR